MKLETITIRISETEKARLRATAEKLDVPMSQLIRQAIKKIIDQEDEK